jgi:uncharacterized membrane protein
VDNRSRLDQNRAMTLRVLCGLVAASSLAGFLFAEVSSSDFASHLDRQTHGIHCSLLPGAGELDTRGTSGCHVTLMSPYSSVLRDAVWGGVPIALPAMGVFAFLVVAALAILVLGRERDRRALLGLTLAAAIPFVTSIAMGWISLHELDAACKLCIGIYLASAAAFVLAGSALFVARRGEPEALSAASASEAEATLPDAPIDAAGQTADAPRLATASEMDRRIAARRLERRGALAAPEPLGWGVVGLGALIGIAFVALPVLAYAAGAPDFSGYVGACGTLAHPEGGDEVLVAIGPQTREVEMIEVLDPLCPSCRGFEARFSAHRAAEEVSRSALLFPLDAECNWMVSESVHPGACLLSRAVLCAEEDAEEVLAWAFAQQSELERREDEETEDAARRVERAVRERFPALGECIASPEARNRLNRALRFAVDNELPVLTPQVYVDGTRLCDEDTDLGLDYVLSRLLDRSEGER